MTVTDSLVLWFLLGWPIGKPLQEVRAKEHSKVGFSISLLPPCRVALGWLYKTTKGHSSSEGDLAHALALNSVPSSYSFMLTGCNTWYD